MGEKRGNRIEMGVGGGEKKGDITETLGKKATRTGRDDRRGECSNRIKRARTIPDPEASLFRGTASPNVCKRASRRVKLWETRQVCAETWSAGKPLFRSALSSSN